MLNTFPGVTLMFMPKVAVELRFERCTQLEKELHSNKVGSQKMAGDVGSCPKSV